MPRRPRLTLPDVPLHITQRGNNRCPCFVDERDRLVYLDLLLAQTRQHGIAVHAYVLMTNHVHLLMTPQSTDAIGCALRNTNQRYAQHFNRSHQRTGTLWEERPHSCLVDADGYLLTCHRYIECNPVRAGMVAKPEDYRWSSYRANALGSRDPVVSPHPLVVSLGGTAEERRREYRDLFTEDLEPAAVDQIRNMTLAGVTVGSESFANRVATQSGRQAAPRKRGRPWPRVK